MPASREHLGSRSRLVLVIAAFLALAWQSLLVQTHVHLDDAGAWQNQPSASGSAPHLALRRMDVEKPGGCALCREQALSGSFLSPGVLSLLAPAAVFTAQIVLPNRTPGTVRNSHTWRSRAPPPPETSTTS